MCLHNSFQCVSNLRTLQKYVFYRLPKNQVAAQQSRLTLYRFRLIVLTNSQQTLQLHSILTMLHTANANSMEQSLSWETSISLPNQEIPHTHQEMWKFTTVFITASHFSLSQGRWIQYTPSHPTPVSINQSINPLACTECGDSLPFSGASSIYSCMIHFNITLPTKPESSRWYPSFS